MTMEDWIKKLNIFLELRQRRVLQDIGSISAEVAKSFAESEWEKYRIIQDQLFMSDFDEFLKILPNEK